MRRCAVMMHARVFSVRFSINQIFPGHFHLAPSPPSTGGPPVVRARTRTYTGRARWKILVEKLLHYFSWFRSLPRVLPATAAALSLGWVGGWLGWPIAYLCVFLLFKHFSSSPLQSRECTLARLEGSGNYRVAGNNIEVKLNKKKRTSHRWLIINWSNKVCCLLKEPPSSGLVRWSGGFTRKRMICYWNFNQDLWVRAIMERFKDN